MIVLMGVPGAGKSMQGRMLADEKGYAWISTGEILRVLVTGKRRHEMQEGKLLSDGEMIRMIDKVLDLINLHEEFVLDGFPRTLKQADWLLDQAHMGRFKISAVFHLVSDESVIRERVESRGRKDDTAEAIKVRFDEYNNVTLPILEDFKKGGVTIYDINGSQTPKEVHKQIIDSLA